MTGHQVSVRFSENSKYTIATYECISVNPSDNKMPGLVFTIQRPYGWKRSIRKYTTRPEGYFYVWTFWSSSQDRAGMTKVVENVMRKLPLTFPINLRLVYNKHYYIPAQDMLDPDKIIEHLRNGK